MARGRRIEPIRHIPLLLLGLALIGCQPAARQELATLRPTPSASARAASPSTSTGPSPSAAAGDVVIEKFVDLVTAGDFSYRARLTGTASGSADTLTVSGSIDVSDVNYSLVVNWKFPRSDSYRVDVRRVGDRVWSRGTGSGWQEIKGFLDEDSNSPFAFVESASDVELVEPVKVDGKQRYKVSIDGARIVDPSYIPAVNLSAESTRKTTFELLLDTAGRPVSGSWRLTGAGRVSGQLQEIAIRLELAFSKVGQPITIRRP